MTSINLVGEQAFPVTLEHKSALKFGLAEQIEAETSLAKPADGQPYILHMLGVPGSGKSTIVTELCEHLSQETAPPYLLDFDRVMTAMPAYQEALNNQAAFSVFELPAREAGYHLLQSLLQKQVNIVFDHGGSPNTHPDILAHAKKQFNYKIMVAEVLCNEQTAMNRITKRNSIHNRHTPVNYVKERHDAIETLKPRYREVADQYIEIDNSDIVKLSSLKKEQITQLAKQLLGI